jgi:hypothetical protein
MLLGVKSGAIFNCAGRDFVRGTDARPFKAPGVVAKLCRLGRADELRYAVRHLRDGNTAYLFVAVAPYAQQSPVAPSVSAPKAANRTRSSLTPTLFGAENSEHASELLNAVNQAIVASSLVTNGDGPAAGPITTRQLRNKMKEIRTQPV